MIYEYISLMFGIVKICLYKLIYPKRVKFKYIPKMNMSFKIAIRKSSTLIIGKNFRSRNNVSFRIYNKAKVSVGDNCFFNDGCSINSQQNIKIGNNVIFGQNVMLFDHDHDYKHDMNEFIRDDIKIGNNVWIGANCIILKGVTIGDNVVVGAGTIINKDILNGLLVYQEKNVIQKNKG